MKDKPVFSTSPTTNTAQSQSKKTPGSTKNTSTSGGAWPEPTQGPIKMRLETKGRGGKTVTVLFNLPFRETDALTLTKELQAAFGVGGTCKDGTIELRGDLRAKIEVYASKKGLKIIRAGG